MEQAIKALRRRFPAVTYREGPLFYWSPKTSEVFYSQKSTEEASVWSLLHETGHALLGHDTYHSDFELVRLEVAAWEKAKLLGKELGIHIDEDHIQDCLDTYRDWLCARSVCPHCNTRALQQGDLQHYQCFNCRAKWKVTPSRFCRAYRLTVPDLDAAIITPPATLA